MLDSILSNQRKKKINHLCNGLDFQGTQKTHMQTIIYSHHQHQPYKAEFLYLVFIYPVIPFVLLLLLFGLIHAGHIVLFLNIVT